MGVSIETYRERIGRSGPGRGYRGTKLSIKIYDGSTGDTDINIRITDRIIVDQHPVRM